MIDWEAIGAIATALATLVALFPIFSSAAARKSKARNLRIRVLVKLTKLRPAIGAIIVPSSLEVVPAHAILPPEELKNIAKELESLLIESEVLTPSEQDLLSQVVANFELMLPALSCNQLPAEGAKSVLAIIDKAIGVLEGNGIMKGEPYQPWKN